MGAFTFWSSLNDTTDRALLQFSGLVLPKSAILEVEHAFALSISLLLAVLVYILLICPESREPTLPEDEIYHREMPLFMWDPVAVIRSYIIRFVTALVIPITMFAPRTVPGRPGRSYNLTLVGIALFLYLVSIVFHSLPSLEWILTVVCRVCTLRSTCMRNMYTPGLPRR